MAIDNIDTALCIGCGTCVRNCPMDVFRLDDAKGKSTIKYAEDCQLCHLCRLYCPKSAITVTSVKYVDEMVGWG